VTDIIIRNTWLALLELNIPSQRQPLQLDTDKPVKVVICLYATTSCGRDNFAAGRDHSLNTIEFNCCVSLDQITCWCLALFHDLLLRSYLYHYVWSVITAHNLTPEKRDNNCSPHSLTTTSCLRNNIQLITGISPCLWVSVMYT